MQYYPCVLWFLQQSCLFTSETLAKGHMHSRSPQNIYCIHKWMDKGRKDFKTMRSYTMYLSHLLKCQWLGRSRPVVLKAGSQINSVSPTWELVRDTNFGAPPKPMESETLGVEPHHLCFNKPSRWFGCMFKFENQSHLLDGETEARSREVTCLNSHMPSVVQPGPVPRSPELQPRCLTSSCYLLCNQNELCICQPFQSPGTESPLLLSLWFHWGLSKMKKKMWLRVVSIRLWAMERSQAIALLFTRGFSDWSCNVIAQCYQSVLSLSPQCMSHMIQFPPIRGTERMNGGQCWPRRRIRKFDIDQGSRITVLFLLMFLFVTRFFLTYFIYSFPVFFSHRNLFCLFLLFVWNHAGCTVKGCFLCSPYLVWVLSTPLLGIPTSYQF